MSNLPDYWATHKNFYAQQYIFAGKNLFYRFRDMYAWEKLLEFLILVKYSLSSHCIGFQSMLERTFFKIYKAKRIGSVSNI